MSLLIFLVESFVSLWNFLISLNVSLILMKYSFDTIISVIKCKPISYAVQNEVRWGGVQICKTNLKPGPLVGRHCTWKRVIEQPSVIAQRSWGAGNICWPRLCCIIDAITMFSCIQNPKFTERILHSIGEQIILDATEEEKNYFAKNRYLSKWPSFFSHKA